MSTPIGFVVVQWNQASHNPELVDGTFSEDRLEAARFASALLMASAHYGRRERYDVAAVHLKEEPPDGVAEWPASTG